jgi:hypothetical protein
MARKNWLKDFTFGLTSLTVKKTGAVVPYGPAILGEMSRWFVFFFTVLGARPAAGRPFTVHFTPDPARPWYLIWAVVRLAGGRIVDRPQGADVVFNFEDSTNNAAPKLPKNSARLMNFACTDISKTQVSAVFQDVFGYGLAVDPDTHSGPAVAKSEHNGAHDGRIIICPARREAHVAYQRVVDNRSADGAHVEDLRTPTVNGVPICVFIKQRPVTRRFANANTGVRLARPEDVYSPQEMALIGQFAQRLGLDWGGLDVLRDRQEGRIYIVDANKTDMGPPTALPLADKMAASRALADALRRFISRDAD